MKNKILICGSCILLIALIGLSSNVSALKPMTLPEIEMIVPDTGLIGDCQLLVDQLVEDAAKCGIKIIPDYTTWGDGVNRMLAGDFEMFYFIGLSMPPADTLDNIIETLYFLFVWYDFWNYYNAELFDKIYDMYVLNFNGFLDEALVVFHEIELILYEEQIAIPISYYYQDTGNHYTRYLFMNCDENGPLADSAIRVALSHLIDRTLYAQIYGDAVVYDPIALSHIFEWSQYHDTTLPDIPYSIGKAVKTVVHAGYLPANAK